MGSPWTKTELACLDKNYGILKAKQISALINRTPGAIYRMASARGLQGPTESKKHKVRPSCVGAWQRFVDGARRAYGLEKESEETNNA